MTLEACFFYFCQNFMKVACNLDNPDHFHEIKGKKMCVIHFLDLWDMYKIAMCNCKRDRLNQLNVDYKYTFSFNDCLSNTKHKVFAFRCKICRYNITGFTRNYFASVVRSCNQTNENLICSHCKQLLHALNFSTLKVCIKERDWPK